MTTVVNEWASLMPHEIKVTSKTTKDDFAYDTYDVSTARSYNCLIDDTDTKQRTTEGTIVTVGLVAYAFAIPIDGTEPVDIVITDKVEIISPVQYATQVRPVVSIAHHYWLDGNLHNIEVRLQ